ncbi:HD domain-containing protein [Maridesulfovibrio bastinii]|jgi:putative hydrolase of HD superfamily|uniref:HD domain-containing protein n=1 Tax=Maridesulfovibrio bastinii TaxID=47157 RepID=UPI0003F9DEC3|nr:HD domain-containing protein [Maridesulfovibrio bastinii]
MKRMKDRDRMTRLADFLFEVGMLRKTPRSGYQFLGSGSESVADHSYRVAVLGYVLADMAGADMARTVFMCLFHDLHEARTGDFNYVNQIYNSSERDDALKHALEGTGLEDKIFPHWEELEECETLESKLAQDADQIDFILNLKEELDLGNKYAGKWLEAAVQRIRTEEGKKLTETICKTDHTDWWFQGPPPSWWAKRNGLDNDD